MLLWILKPAASGLKEHGGIPIKIAANHSGALTFRCNSCNKAIKQEVGLLKRLVMCLTPLRTHTWFQLGSTHLLPAVLPLEPWQFYTNRYQTDVVRAYMEKPTLHTLHWSYHPWIGSMLTRIPWHKVSVFGSQKFQPLRTFATPTLVKCVSLPNHLASISVRAFNPVGLKTPHAHELKPGKFMLSSHSGIGVGPGLCASPIRTKHTTQQNWYHESLFAFTHLPPKHANLLELFLEIEARNDTPSDASSNTYQHAH